MQRVQGNGLGLFPFPALLICYSDSVNQSRGYLNRFCNSVVRTESKVRYDDPKALRTEQGRRQPEARPGTYRAKRQQAGVVLYGTLVIAYLFLGGAAGGTFLVMASWSLVLHRSYPHRSALVRRDFRLLRGRIYALATATLAAAMLCLLWDLDYPERALMIFMAARPTVLTFGACVLTGLLIVGALLVLANLFHLRFFTGAFKRMLEVVCASLAIAVMGYTGVFLYSNVGISFWHTPLLVGLFFCSALSSGLSTTMLADYFSHAEAKLVHAVRPLQKCHLACLAAELLFMIAFVATAWTNLQSAGAIAALLSPEVLSTALVGALGLGIAVPAALESYALLRKEQRAIPVSDFVCLIGALCLRWTVIVCGVH